MGKTTVISGSAMAVLLGFSAVLTSLFLPTISLGDRTILFFIGLFMILAGLKSSKG